MRRAFGEPRRSSSRASRQHRHWGRRVARGGQGRGPDLPIFRARVVHPEQTRGVPELQRQTATAAPEPPRTPANETTAETGVSRRLPDRFPLSSPPRPLDCQAASNSPALSATCWSSSARRGGPTARGWVGCCQIVLSPHPADQLVIIAMRTERKYHGAGLRDQGGVGAAFVLASPDPVDDQLFICKDGRMEKLSRVTPAALDVLRVLVWTPADVHGFALAKEAGRPTGSVYTILSRLEDAGWVESYWEVNDDQHEGRPRRRFYRLNSEGLEAARSLLADRDRKARTPSGTPTDSWRPGVARLWGRQA